MSGFVLMAGSVFLTTACGGMTSLSPTSPSASFGASTSISAPGATPAPAPAPAPAAEPGQIASAQMVAGTVLPVGAESPPCWADRYPCEVFDFTLAERGTIDVTLTWDGGPRAMMVQLYWAGEGLAHEDVAPREGPSQITFHRGLMEAHDYRLRVVSLEPGQTIPFTLTVTY